MPVKPEATVTVEAVSSVKDVVPSPLLPLACCECACSAFETASAKAADLVAVNHMVRSVVDR